MNAGTIDVLLVDDHQMVLEGLAALVSRDPRMRVVGQCGESMKVLEEARRLSPDVIVLDIDMPELNGLDLCRDLRKKLKETAILMVTMYDEKEFLVRAIDNGASGFVGKEAPGEELLQAIRTVAHGKMYLPGGIGRDFLDRIRGAQDDPFERLTARERQVFQMIAEGQTSRKIAGKLSLAVKTVGAHRTRLMRKLDIHNVEALVKLALRRGVVHLPQTGDSGRASLPGK